MSLIWVKDYRFSKDYPPLGVRLEHRRWGGQAWQEVKVKKRHRCVITGTTIPKGHLAFRPLTNAGNRYERISKEGMQSLKG